MTFFVEKLGIFVSNVYLSLSLKLFRLKVNNKPKSLSKRGVQVIYCQFSQEIRIKKENIVSSRLSFQGNAMI